MKKTSMFAVILAVYCLQMVACRKQTSPTAANGAKVVQTNNTPEQASLLEGNWRGVLQVQKTRLHVELHVLTQPDGSQVARLDSPDQFMNGMPANALQFNAPNVKIEWQKIGGIFDGHLQAGKLSGTWRQGGANLPLVFERD